MAGVKMSETWTRMDVHLNRGLKLKCCAGGGLETIVGQLMGHLGTPPALLPLLLLQLSVLHCELQAGQLAHEGLVAHMQRGGDGQLRAHRKCPKAEGEG